MAPPALFGGDMPKIRMKRTTRGSPDGLTVNCYVQGVEYDVPDSLVIEFRTMGAIEAPDGDHDIENQAIDPRTETAAIPMPKRGRPRKVNA